MQIAGGGGGHVNCYIMTQYVRKWIWNSALTYSCKQDDHRINQRCSC